MFSTISFKTIKDKFGSIENFINISHLGIDSTEKFIDFENYLMSLINTEIENFKIYDCRLIDSGLFYKYLAGTIKITMQSNCIENFDYLVNKKNISLVINNIFKKTNSIYMHVNEHDIIYNKDNICLYIYCRISK